MRIGRLISACAFTALVAIVPATQANAQTKGETKLYTTAIAKNDLKTANKFLAKYPQSIYAPKIQRLKDSIVFNSLNAEDVTAYMKFVQENPASFFADAANKKIEELNTSSISDSQAMEGAIEAGLPKEKVLTAKGVKSLNKEHIIAIVAPENGFYTIATLIKDNDKWSIASQIKEAVYTNDYALKNYEIYGNPQAVTINGTQHLYFCYTNSSKEIDKRSGIANNNCELAFNLYSLTDNSVYNILYSGKTKEGLLYGSTMDSAQGGAMATPQQKYLMQQLRSTEIVKPYDKELFHTQEIIEWWYENNPQNSGNLQFGGISETSELATLFNNSKNKEEVGIYTVAMFDICNNTVVIVYNKEDKRHSLAICQKLPTKKDELELNSFYGEKGNTLVLYYFKGKNSIKKRLNLGSKRLY